jgi:hypothetical protein
MKNAFHSICWFRSLVLLPLLLLASGLAWAQGTLTHLSGGVSLQKGDALAQRAVSGAQLSVGDTVITGATGFVRIAMTDGSEMVVRPNSRLVLQAYGFDTAKPESDQFALSLLKGGLRSVSGVIGKRNNPDAYKLTTPTAIIGIRGTQFDTRVCDDPRVSDSNCGALAIGTYVSVRFGAIQASNASGALNVAAGQVVRVPLIGMPVLLPRDPGIGFTPPPSIPKVEEKKKAPASVEAPLADATTSDGQKRNASSDAALTGDVAPTPSAQAPLSRSVSNALSELTTLTPLALPGMPSNAPLGDAAAEAGPVCTIE